jgi:Cu/Ag efflux protein CusF
MQHQEEMHMKLFRLLSMAALLAVGAAHAGELSEGEIRKVDKDAAKLTIRHGEL